MFFVYIFLFIYLMEKENEQNSIRQSGVRSLLISFSNYPNRLISNHKSIYLTNSNRNCLEIIRKYLQCLSKELVPNNYKI